MFSCVKADLQNNSTHCALTLQLLMVYARDIMGGGEELSEYTQENLTKELAKRSNCHVFLGFIDEEPAGLAICFEAFSTFACKPLINIHDLCVVPNHRRKGVATSLIFAIENFAHEIGCCKLTLEVLEGNHGAKATYINAGFEAYQLDEDAGCALFWQKKIKY
eukprot:gene10558-14184_t